MTNVPDQDTASRIARELVDLRLAACVNVLAPCQSVYRWQGQVESAQEVPLVIKCTTATYAALEARLIDLHPYDVPEVVAIPLVAGAASYLAWVAESTASSAA